MILKSREHQDSIGLTEFQQASISGADSKQLGSAMLSIAYLISRVQVREQALPRAAADHGTECIIQAGPTCRGRSCCAENPRTITLPERLLVRPNSVGLVGGALGLQGHFRRSLDSSPVTVVFWHYSTTMTSLARGRLPLTLRCVTTRRPTSRLRENDRPSPGR